MNTSNSVRNVGSWVFAKALSMTQPSLDVAEKALANAVARKHEEEMRHKALELSLGYQSLPWKGDRR